MRTTLAMETGSSAPTKVAAAFMPLARSLTLEWEQRGDETVLHVEHTEREAAGVVALARRAHPRVRVLTSS